VSRKSRIDGEDGVEDDDAVKDGDRLLQQLNRCRGMMLPQEKWPSEVREFAGHWSRFKAAHALMDFCDLIETALRDVRIAPGNPSVVVADEAQDLNRMLLSLVRQWGENSEYLVLAGDDDQTIYGWAGASPEAILDPDIPEDHKIFLQQSERLPRSVHAVAEQLIHQVSRRQPKSYFPRPEDGEVHRLVRGGYRSPEYGILKAAEHHLSQGKSVMFLASCAYMLTPITTVLRREGIPFHNPYRKSNGYWNPLRIESPGSAASRISALLAVHSTVGERRRRWTNHEVILWTEWLAVNGVLRGDVRRILATLPANRQITADILRELFESDAFESLMAAVDGSPLRLLEWWLSRLAPDFRKRTEFPARAAKKFLPEALRRTCFR
jgi:hypothetical protein